jgi:hypothetical protein
MDVQLRQLRSCASDSTSSEARKRGSGGGSPRKHDEVLTGASDLGVQPRQLVNGAVLVTARRATKRGSGGGSPRKHNEVLTVASDLGSNSSFGPGCSAKAVNGAVLVTVCRAKREDGGLGHGGDTLRNARFYSYIT